MMRLRRNGSRGWLAGGVWFALLIPAAAAGGDISAALEEHAANKQRLLASFQSMSPSASVPRCGTNVREVWRHVLIDGPYAGLEKPEFLRRALSAPDDAEPGPGHAWKALLDSHERLFGEGRNVDLMVRCASDPAFEPFGRHVSPAKALAEITQRSDAEIQAFQTLFETGRNTRGYVHKLECHGQAVEYIYAVTDIVYGVMRPSELAFGVDRVTAEPARVRMFYVKAGAVIALHPYVLHSGALSVEPDHLFSILIYKKPVDESEPVADLPRAWRHWKDSIRIAGVDTYLLTLEELHTGHLKDNRGFIAGKRPLRLPAWN